METTNSPYVVATAKEHTYIVTFLHGRDSAATEFADEFFESQASDNRTLPEIFPAFKWVFPFLELRNSAQLETGLFQ
jgi:lysophospholipase II